MDRWETAPQWHRFPFCISSFVMMCHDLSSYMFPQKATHQTPFADDALNMISIDAIVLENHAQESYINVM